MEKEAGRRQSKREICSDVSIVLKNPPWMLAKWTKSPAFPQHCWTEGIILIVGGHCPSSLLASIVFSGRSSVHGGAAVSPFCSVTVASAEVSLQIVRRRSRRSDEVLRWTLELRHIEVAWESLDEDGFVAWWKTSSYVDLVEWFGSGWSEREFTFCIFVICAFSLWVYFIFEGFVEVVKLSLDRLIRCVEWDSSGMSLQSNRCADNMVMLSGIDLGVIKFSSCDIFTKRDTIFIIFLNLNKIYRIQQPPPHDSIISNSLPKFISILHSVCLRKRNIWKILSFHKMKSHFGLDPSISEWKSQRAKARLPIKPSPRASGQHVEIYRHLVRWVQVWWMLHLTHD